MQLNVKITGSGTPDEVIKSLETALNVLKTATELDTKLKELKTPVDTTVAGKFKIYLKNKTLCTEIEEQ